MSEELEWNWMRRAVDLAKLSVSEPDKPAAPHVGVVIVRDEQVLAEAYRGKRRPGDHAEYCALMDSGITDIRGSVVYTTLEPCTRRGTGKTPCARRLVDAGVSEVVIGMYDPSPHIFRQGWRMLRDAGICLRDFSPDLRAELKVANLRFLEQYSVARANQGSAVFDYMLDRDYVIESGSTFRTSWSPGGHGTIWACGQKGYVTLARFASSIAEVSDPGALDFREEKWQVPVCDGEVVVFGNDAGAYLILKVNHVLAGDRGDNRFELAFDWEVRAPSVPISK